MLEIKISSPAKVEPEIKKSTDIPIEFNREMQISNDDHALLRNREEPNQHPIGAITGLQAELDKPPQAALSIEEIDQLIW